MGDVSSPDSHLVEFKYLMEVKGFPGGSVSKGSVCNTEDLGLIPGLGRSPGEGNNMSVQGFGIDNASIVRGKYGTKSSVWNRQTNKQTKNPPSLGREQSKNNSLIIHMTHTHARISQLSLFMMRMQT